MNKYKILDILYANLNGDKKVTSNILNPNEGYIPIGLCITETNFFGNNEPARWMSLKYMSYETPDIGSLKPRSMYCGNYGNNLHKIKNIQFTHNNGFNYGYLNVDYSNITSNLLPSIFTKDNNWNISILGSINKYAMTDIDGKNKTINILTTATAQSIWQTDTFIINNSNINYAPAACCCWRYHTLGTQQGDWYLGSCGEMCMIIDKKTNINTKLLEISTIYPNDCINILINDYKYYYWTSTLYDNNCAYCIDISDGYIDYFDMNKYWFYVIAIFQY